MAIEIIDPNLLPIKVVLDGTEELIFINPSTKRLEKAVLDGFEVRANKALDFLIIDDVKYPTTKAVNDLLTSEKGTTIATLDGAGKLTLSQLPDVAITSVIVAVETTIADFALNNANYTFEQGDVILIDDAGNVTHYLFIGGNKFDVNEYSQISASQVTIGQVVGLQAALDTKLEGATNGLSINGLNVEIGGVLIKNTTIDTAGNILIIEGDRIIIDTDETHITSPTSVTIATPLITLNSTDISVPVLNEDLTATEVLLRNASGKLKSVPKSSITGALKKDGVGYVITDRTDGANHGTVGQGGFDLSVNNSLMPSVGAAAFVVGMDNTGNNGSFVSGSSNEAGTEGFASGGINSIGNSGFGAGRGNFSPSFAESVLGHYNTNYTPIGTVVWNANDRLFSLGNGTDDLNRSNAVEIFKDGTSILDKLKIKTVTEDLAVTDILGRNGSDEVVKIPASKITEKLLPIDYNNSKNAATIVSMDLETIPTGSYVAGLSTTNTNKPFNNVGGLISFGSSSQTSRIVGARDGSDNLWFSSGVSSNPYHQVATREYVEQEVAQFSILRWLSTSETSANIVLPADTPTMVPLSEQPFASHNIAGKMSIDTTNDWVDVSNLSDNAWVTMRITYEGITGQADVSPSVRLYDDRNDLNTSFTIHGQSSKQKNNKISSYIVEFFKGTTDVVQVFVETDANETLKAISLSVKVDDLSN